MQVKQYFLPTQPQNTWQLIKTGFSICKHTFRQVVGLVMISEIVHIAMLFLPKILTSNVNVFYYYLPTMIVDTIVFISIIYRINKFINGEHVSFSQAVLINREKLLPVIAICLIYSFAVLIGILLLIVPGIILSVYLFFSVYLVILEKNITIIASIKSSYKIVSGNWWFTSWVISIIILIVVLFYFLNISLLFLVSAFIVKKLSLEEFVIMENIKIIIEIFIPIMNLFIIPFCHSSILATLYNLRFLNKSKIVIN